MLKKIKWVKRNKTNGKRLFECQKKLLSLFDNLKTIFNENENESVNENENESGSENESESDDESKKEKKNITMR